MPEPNRIDDRRLDPLDWLDYPKVIGQPTADERANFPDFLVISPAKTGTTWLAANLRRDPRILIPPEKEVRFFDALWRQCSIGWYCHRFARESGRLAGDASPSYALLPSSAIKYIHSIKPDLKLILLLRDLPARAWSHLKHMSIYGEANFCGHAGKPEKVAFDDQVRNLVHDVALSNSDYEGIIRRWRGYFPKEQIHIAFFEDAIGAPEKYFAGLCKFLGIDADPSIEFSAGPVNEGERLRPSQALTEWMNDLYASRRKRLDVYLTNEFGLKSPWPTLPSSAMFGRPRPLPPESHGLAIELSRSAFRLRRNGALAWLSILVPRRVSNRSAKLFVGDLLRKLKPSLFADHPKLSSHGFSLEDQRLVYEIDRLLGEMPNFFPLLIKSVPGYNIVYFKGKFVGLPQSAGPIDIAQCDFGTLPYVFDRQDELEQTLLALAEESQPRLIGETADYNVVQFQGQFIGLLKSLGPIDLTKYDLSTLPYVFDSREALERALSNPAAEPAQSAGP